MEFLYVAQGVNGLLKVGRTKDTKKRSAKLKQEFKEKGDVLIRIEFCDPVDSAYGCEHSVICATAKIQPQHSGREWFVGGDFEQIFAIAKIKSDESRKTQAYWKTPAGIKRKAEQNVQTAVWLFERNAAKAAAEERRAQYFVELAKRRVAKQRRVLGPIGSIATFLCSQGA